ncbi:MAG: hypothetical protein ABL921_09655 [Pirellula sp.]
MSVKTAGTNEEQLSQLLGSIMRKMGDFGHDGWIPIALITKHGPRDNN